MGEWSASCSSCFGAWRKSQYCPLNRALCGLQSQSACFGEEKNKLLLPGTEHGLVQYTVKLAEAFAYQEGLVLILGAVNKCITGIFLKSVIKICYM